MIFFFLSRKYTNDCKGLLLKYLKYFILKRKLLIFRLNHSIASFILN